MTRTKIGTLIFQVRGLDAVLQPHPVQHVTVEKLLKNAVSRKQLVRPRKNQILRTGSWNVLSLYRSVARRSLVEI